MLSVLLFSLLAPAIGAPADDPQGIEFFEKNVRPILVERCFQCHSSQAKKLRGGLFLDTKSGWTKGGDTGPAIVPGNPETSLLIKAVRYGDPDLQMPPKGKLTDREVAILVDWVKRGAPDPRAGSATPAAGRTIDIAHGRTFWSFQPIKRVEPPRVRDESWIRTPIDRFILARLAQAGLTPTEVADRRQLIRRASFDLIGLPPDPADVDAFLKDQSPKSYENMIDRLLDSPHYGERWGRHWLDLARYAESHGYEQDYDRPSAYHYRDFVIEALNQDMPYDRFVQWQIAGDELAGTDNLALKATGFLAAGTHATQITANQVEKERYDELDDMANTIGTSMLGLTIGCARCHDHKYDPIPQRDYYRLVSTFTRTVRSEIDLNTDPAGFARAKAAWRQEHDVLQASLDRYETDSVDRQCRQWDSSAPAPLDRSAVRPEIGWILARPTAARTPDETALLRTWARATDPAWHPLYRAVVDHAIAEPKPQLVKALISSEGLPAIRLHTQGGDFLEKTHLLKRGDPNQKMEEVNQSFLQVLMLAPDVEKHWWIDPPPGWRTSYRRSALARWITDVDQGAGHLLARVIVNRLWQHHLGRGLVATPSDFGAQGDRPSHPELLDWLAAELIAGGWRLKPIHKLIMTSATYQQGSRLDPARTALDPENKLCSRQSRRRLEAEIIRDAMLAASGTLDESMYGPGTLDDHQQRRSIYFMIKRSKLIPMMTLFDAPDTLQSIAVRSSTIIAPQSLMLMNSPIVRSWAAAFARRVLPTARTSSEEGIRLAYRIALARDPSPNELDDARAFLDRQAHLASGSDSTQALERDLTDLCQVLFGLNEFIFIE